MKNRTINSMYLSKKARPTAAVMHSICIVIGSFSTAFWVLGLALAIADVNNLRQNLIVVIFMVIPSALLWYKGAVGKRWIDRANRYNSSFMCSNDGIVTVSDLTKQMGKEASVVIAEVDRLLEKGYLRGCTLQKGSQPCVVLSDSSSADCGKSFVVVQCDACGGSTRLRAGSVGKCEYCGRSLKG